MKKRRIIITGMAVMLIALLLAGCSGNDSDNGNGNDTRAGSGIISSGDVTLEQFDSIEIGMSYDEVAEILGRPGELAHEAGVTRVYHWANSLHTALVTVIIVDGEVDSTAQVGLD